MGGVKYHPVAMECQGDFKAAFQEALEGLFQARSGPCRELQPFGAGVEMHASWKCSQKCSENRLFTLFLRCIHVTADSQVIPLSLALDLCVVWFMWPSLSPCCTFRPGGGGWWREAGGGARALVSMGRRLRRRTCVIYSANDGDSLMVPNELSLGAPGKNNTIHFYSNACYTQSLVGGGNGLFGHACRGTLPCPFLSLAPIFLKGTEDARHAGW